MKKLTLLIMLVLFAVSALSAAVTLLSEDEYKKLSSQERDRYNSSLTDEFSQLNTRKAEATSKKDQLGKDIEALKQEKASLGTEYQTVYNRIMDYLGVPTSALSDIQARLEAYNQQLGDWERLSDDQLWAAKKDIRKLNDEFDEYAKSKYAKVPDFLDNFSDLKIRFSNLQRSVTAADPSKRGNRNGYTTEDYSVKRGDTLSKISGYDFIYGDPSKWGIIYRANRDQIKDPNVISVDQVLKIPRGLPNSWKVWRGESLWKIASYPEVYGKGSRWPEIYRANQDKIKDPDLIYPGQVFDIPRD